MDETQMQLLTTGGVLGVILVTMLVNGRIAKRDMARRAGMPATAVSPGFVGKYAILDGAVVGKVVALEGDRLVVEQAGVRSTVEAAAAKEQGHDVVLSKAPARE